MTQIKIKNEYPAKFQPIVKSKKRWNIVGGGRGSGKSWSMADIFITRMLADGKPRLCTRHIQKSIKDSSHKLLANKIRSKGLESLFDIQASTIKCANGGEFIFKGMNDLGSLEGMADAWIEEAQTATQADIDLLIPTIRSEGSQIFATYNPKNEDDPIYVIDHADEYADMRVSVFMNWQDNPWFPKVLYDEMQALKKINFELYNHIYEGQILMDFANSIINPDWFNYYEELPSIKQSYIVADTASQAKEQNDFTVFLFIGIGLDGNIYLMDLWRGKLEAPKRIKKAREFWNKHKSRMGYGIGAKEFKVELASSGFDIIQHLRNERNMKISGIKRTKSQSTFAGKFGRLMDVISVIAEGKVFLPKSDIYYDKQQVTDASWVSEFERECHQFKADDTHKHDDQVDVLIDGIKLLHNSKSERVIKALYS